MSRVIIAHGHIFKNAGTTLDWALARNFGEGFVDHRDNQPMRVEGAAYLGPYLAERPWIVALSSHHLCYPLPSLPRTKFHLLYLLRHPIERVLSVYNFEKLQEPSTPGAINAKRFDLPEYVDWRLEPGSGPTIRDYQTRYLSGRLRQAAQSMTEDDLAVALDTLETGALVGVVERFDESMVAFEAGLRPDFPALDLSYVRQNVGADPARSRTSKLGELEARLGQDRYDRLLEANRQDIELYGAASRALDQRLSGITGAAAATEEFLERNHSLAASFGAR